MQNMIDFTTWVLGSLATFLGTPPIFYLFALVLFCFICKAFKIILGR